ncbi:hypothetical protein PF005_g26927 [Phytophthora fragariae]|nr:hypothetical protein PF003_g23031 [Phytophthora fragariae]KAE8920037.1 hypothetical protein PF009_g29663 [Phytophthora fragariae]KAE8984804.1 hypothetical protein PF011_g20639 [Phytophthora fragariae]KAE9064919.1 hypothetical protein PF007_g29026 [Phytophthora fragariae]KAE9072531.1 hypothetical protein PF006_g28912 [Phytophthora fragariae]
MSLNLVDDSEAFEAALHFVDEYVEAERGNGDDAALSLALDGLPSPTELALVDAVEVAPVSQSSSKKQSKRTKKSPKSTTSKPNRPLSYNPNRAREQQRKELLYL